MENNISLKELEKKCRKNSYDCRCSEKILNKFSIYFTWLFSKTSITPNQITFLMIVNGIVGGVFLATGNYIHALMGSLFLYLFLVFDLVDGEVARYKKIFSRKGKFLDFVANDIVFASTFLGLSLGIFNGDCKLFGYALYHNPIVLITGMITIIFFAFFKLSSCYAKDIDENLQESFLKSDRVNGRIKSIVLKISNNVFYDTIVVMLVIVGVIFRLSQYILLFYAGGYILRYFVAVFLKMNNKNIK